MIFFSPLLLLSACLPLASPFLPPRSSWMTMKMTLPCASHLCFMMWHEGPNRRGHPKAALSPDTLQATPRTLKPLKPAKSPWRACRNAGSQASPHRLSFSGCKVASDTSEQSTKRFVPERTAGTPVWRRGLQISIQPSVQNTQLPAPRSPRPL